MSYKMPIITHDENHFPLSKKKRYTMRNWIRGLKDGTRFNGLLNSKKFNDYR